MFACLVLLHKADRAIKKCQHQKQSDEELQLKIWYVEFLCINTYFVQSKEEEQKLNSTLGDEKPEISNDNTDDKMSKQQRKRLRKRKTHSMHKNTK